MSTAKPANLRVIVVGGGIAGLATAWLLRDESRRRGHNLHVTILEAADVPGGSTRTEREQGFVCEWGPNGFLDNEPLTFELIRRLQLEHRLVRADAAAARRFIYHSGKMRELPLKPATFLSSNILPAAAKLRMALELFIPAKRNGREETVHQFGARRLGRAFADYLLDPMVSGIFAGDARELSLPAVFPKMVELERDYGGLFRALLAKQREAKRAGKPSGGPASTNSILYTFQDGMGELTTALARDLHSELRVNSPVQAVAQRGHSWQVQSVLATHTADAVVLACPSYAAADLLQGFAPAVSAAVRAIPFAPVDVVCHAHRVADVPHNLRGFGVLIPRTEGIRSLGSLWCNSIFPGQAPLGLHLLRTIIGGARDPAVVDLSDAEVEAVAASDHHTLFGVHKPPVFRRVLRHPRGIAQYTIGHRERVGAAEQLEHDAPGLFFTGASYRGVSINGCVKDAFRVVERLLSQLETTL